MTLMTTGSAECAPRYVIAVFFARIVMPFSRSSSLESIARSSRWACSANELVWRSMASTSVVLPWSTWATIATLRRSERAAEAMGNILEKRGRRRPEKAERRRHAPAVLQSTAPGLFQAGAGVRRALTRFGNAPPLQQDPVPSAGTCDAGQEEQAWGGPRVVESAPVRLLVR